MSFSVQCPKCSKSLKATTLHIGRQAKCPKCGSLVTISAPGEDQPSLEPAKRDSQTTEPAIPPIPDIPTPDSSQSTRKPGKSTYSLHVVIGIAAGSATVAMLVGYFVGREHIKYEIRSTLAETGEAIKAGIREAFGGNANPESEEQANEEAAAFERQAPFAVGKVHAAGAFSLALVDVRVDHAEVKSSFGDGTLELDEKYLLCTFRVTNTDERRILNFHDSGSFGSSYFTLQDDVKNHIRGVGFGFSNDLVGAISIIDDILPGEQRTHLEVFTIPPPKTEHLILTISLEAFGGDGRIKYKIPSAQIEGFSQSGT